MPSPRAVSVNAAQSTQAVQIVDNLGPLDLGGTVLGRGTFSATSNAGNITQSGGIIQERARARRPSRSVAAKSTLSNSGNRFTGGVVSPGLLWPRSMCATPILWRSFPT